jgi:hypothetical protein
MLYLVSNGLPKAPPCRILGHNGQNSFGLGGLLGLKFSPHFLSPINATGRITANGPSALNRPNVVTSPSSVSERSRESIRGCAIFAVPLSSWSRMLWYLLVFTEDAWSIGCFSSLGMGLNPPCRHSLLIGTAVYFSLFVGRDLKAG